jgi:hypothetical protein
MVPLTIVRAACKAGRLEVSRTHLTRYRHEADAFLERIITADETWAYYYEPKSEAQSMTWKRLTSHVARKFGSQP